MTDPDVFLEAAIANAFPPVLFAPCTFVYQCHANLVLGVECCVFGDVRTAVEFPTDYRE